MDAERAHTAADERAHTDAERARTATERAHKDAERASEPGADTQALPASNGRKGLLIDWGGVLTTNLFASFHEYCVRREISTEELITRFSKDSGFRELLIALEKGTMEESTFEERFAELLGVNPQGLIDGLFEGVQPDMAMIEAVRRAREEGIRTALVSNSWGVQRYPHELFEEIFDGIVISGQEGTRKPSKRMYELGAQRAGVAANLCVFVDDLPFNLEPAKELGMATIHHTSADDTIPKLEQLLGVRLATGS